MSLDDILALAVFVAPVVGVLVGYLTYKEDERE